MKLPIAVLTSILFACSFTTANPIHPSSTTSAESRTLTAANAQVTSLVDFSKLSRSAKNSIKKYAKIKQDYEKTEKMYGLAKVTEADHEKLVSELTEKYLLLKQKSQAMNDNSRYENKLNKAKLELEAQNKILLELEEKCTSLSCKLLDLFLKLSASEKKLKKHLLENDPNSILVDFYTKLLGLDSTSIKLILKPKSLIPNQFLRPKKYSAGMSLNPSQQSPQDPENSSPSHHKTSKNPEHSDKAPEGSNLAHSSSKETSVASSTRPFLDLRKASFKLKICIDTFDSLIVVSKWLHQ
ncbi:hypothetical protein BDEG_23199 [Batrachochytrium dendrobatidis JEL423]|uniref:Uncharacterized protein n=1 Tax=Batrachochytrium dendrobatidis (strain JEL423) TaxID=403673 RepID=A0A177WGZ8_BATDL|nr:hypothetical protein BDEG_23199 [Batrachochytrium dendrobatidis JEL423]